MLAERPTSREVGQIIGATIGRMPLDDFMRPFSPESYAAAGISVADLRARYLALMVCAALHAIESAGLSPDTEAEVAGGLYDWAGTCTDVALRSLLSNIEEATDAYAEAAADDAEKEKHAGFSELELEFCGQLIELGEEVDSRVQACLRLSAVLPKHLWHAQYASATQSLSTAGLVRSNDA